MIRIVSGIIQASRWRAAAAVGLMAAVSLSEGTAVLLLLPLLQIAGVDIQATTLDGLAAPLKKAFGVMGLEPTLIAVLVAYVIVTAMQATLVRVQSLFDSSIVQDYIQHLRARLYRAITQAEWLELTRIRSSDFTFALTTASDRVANAAHQVFYIGATGFVAAVYLLLAVIVSPAMSGIVIAAATVILLSQLRTTRDAQIPGEELDESTSSLYATAAEQIGGLKTARSYGNEELHVQTFLENGTRLNQAVVSMTRAYASLKWRQTVGAVIALCLMLYLAVSVFHLPTAALLLLLLLFSRFVPRLISLQQTLQSVIGALPALQTIESLIESCERAVEHNAAQQLPISPGTIQVSKASFTYGTDARSALSGATLEVPQGETTALVGSSGAGKTTLADLLLGLIRADDGCVRVGSMQLDSAHLRSWRSHIGYVAQDTYLFNDSIRANLSWAQPGATEEEMQVALQGAACAQFVSSLPHGIDTVIGERGVRLSGGERQRLSLARALLRKPWLLILDEATSALDSENEQRIYTAIDHLHGAMTILIITHRLSTIRGADLIHVMDGGQIVASGTWDSLMAGDNARFRELCLAQGIE